jgi:DNA-binding response OmpR family regulator
VQWKRLSFEGHRVEAVGDAESALEKLANRHFDIVFTDLGLPKMPGDVLAREIKKQSPQQIVVMVTGNGEPLNQKQVEQSSIDFTLQKPFHMRELREIMQAITLRQAVETSRPAELLASL